MLGALGHLLHVIHYGDLPTWLAAIGTVSAVFVVLHQSRKDHIAQRERERRDHASHISAWPTELTRGEHGSDVTIQISNTSNEPVYTVILFRVFIQGAAPHTGEDWIRVMSSQSGWLGAYVPFGAILPGKYHYTFKDVDTGIMQARVAAEIAFIDRAGKSWVRRATGALEELANGPVEYYKLEIPLSYQPPMPSS